MTLAEIVRIKLGYKYFKINFEPIPYVCIYYVAMVTHLF